MYVDKLVNYVVSESLLSQSLEFKVQVERDRQDREQWIGGCLGVW